jgi:hypothetical protein
MLPGASYKTFIGYTEKASKMKGPPERQLKGLEIAQKRERKNGAIPN